MSETCKHCGSGKVTGIYTDTFPASGSDQDEFTRLEEVELFDCLNCGEMAQNVVKLCSCDPSKTEDLESSDTVTSLICWGCLTRYFGLKGQEKLYSREEWLKIAGDKQ